MDVMYAREKTAESALGVESDRKFIVGGVDNGCCLTGTGRAGCPIRPIRASTGKLRLSLAQSPPQLPRLQCLWHLQRTTRAKDTFPAPEVTQIPTASTRDTLLQHIHAQPVSRPFVLTSTPLYLPTCPATGRALVNRYPEIFRPRPVEQNLSRVFSALLQSNPVTAFTYARLLFLDSASTCPQDV
jgi:hypothetical protein